MRKTWKKCALTRPHEINLLCTQLCRIDNTMKYRLPLSTQTSRNHEKRFELSKAEGGLVHIFTINDANLNDNGEVNLVCEDVAKSKTACLEVVPIIFQVPPEDARICDAETATFTATTNKAGVKVRSQSNNFLSLFSKYMNRF